MYIAKNDAALISGAPIALPSPSTANIANNLKPSMSELKLLGLIHAGFSDSPTAGNAYVINIELKPTGCSSACTAVGYIFLQDPVTGPDGKTSDIRVLSAAAFASDDSQVGFSMPTPGSIASPTITGRGWSLPNPDPAQRPGILYVTTQNFGATVQDDVFWKSPAATHAALPTSTIFAGEGRYVLDTSKPYMWSNASGWGEAFTNPTTKDIAFGGSNDSGVANSYGLALGMGSFARESSIHLGSKSGQYSIGKKNIVIGQLSSTGSTANSESNVYIGSSYWWQPNSVILDTKSNINMASGTAPIDTTNNIYISSTPASYYYSGSTPPNKNIFINSITSKYTITQTTYIGHQSGSYGGFWGASGADGQICAGKESCGYANLKDLISLGTLAGKSAGFWSGGGAIKGDIVALGYEAGTYAVALNAVAVGTMTAEDAGFWGSGTYSGSPIAIGTGSGDYMGGNTVSIGYYAQPSSFGGAGSIRFSGTQVGGQVAWSNASDLRLKSDIQPTKYGLNFIRGLRPVDYLLKDSKAPQTGFIAQDVKSVASDFPGLTHPSFGNSYYSLNYSAFIGPIVKSIQELNANSLKEPSHWISPEFFLELSGYVFGLLLAVIGWLFFINARTRAQLNQIVATATAQSHC